MNYFEPEKSKHLFSTIEALKLQQLIDCYTRLEEGKYSGCLDHIYIQQKSLPNILERGVVHFSRNDHDVIYCTWFAPTLVKIKQESIQGKQPSMTELLERYERMKRSDERLQKKKHASHQYKSDEEPVFKVFE